MSVTPFILDIASQGPIRLRAPATAAPVGCFAADDDWYIPHEELHAYSLKAGPINGRLRLVHADGKDAAAAAAGHFAKICREAIVRARPDPRPEAPCLNAGIVTDGLLGALESEQHRPRQLDSYRDAWVAASGSGPDRVWLLEERLLRHLATLEVPSFSTLRLRHENGGISLHLQESGALERLFDCITIKPFEADHASCEFCFDRANSPDSEYRVAILVGKARAVQLASLAVAFGMARTAPLTVSVTHAGLAGATVRLQLDHTNRAAALAKLGRLLAHARSSFPLSSAMNANFSADGAELVVLPAGGWAESRAETVSLRRRHPVAWQAESCDGLPAWTYAGDDPSAYPRLGLLPFALITGGHPAAFPADGRPSTHGLAPGEVDALRAWLDGPRGSAGFRPVFGHLYLQGLEYRLLVDESDPAEAAALRNEIAAIAALPDMPEDLAASAHVLLDWLGATGKRALRQPLDEGRLAALVGLGQMVIEGKPLDALCAWAYVRHQDPELGALAQDRFISRFEEMFPSGILLCPIGIKLRASYRSISGLCDQCELPLGSAGSPLPDLRADRRLQAALLRMRKVV